MNTAPAARSRAAATESVFFTWDFSRILEPARVTSPATSKRSLSDTGRPSTGERRTPFFLNRSE